MVQPKYFRRVLPDLDPQVPGGGIGVHRPFDDLGYTTPRHDINSHGADALGEFAVNCRIFPRELAAVPKLKPMPKLQFGQVYLPGRPRPDGRRRIKI